MTYVWFDALVNYVSALEYLPKEKPAGTRYWPADVHLVGKDILTTHAVYWSTMLMALELNLPKTIFAHGWWTVDGEKMSKSRGNVVDPNEIIAELQAPGAVEASAVDAFRYFLLREVPFGQDGDFSEQALVRRSNSDLANGLGNLLSRTLTMIERYCDGAIPTVDPHCFTVDEIFHRKQIESLGEVLESSFSDLAFNNLLLHIATRISDVDVFIDRNEPWKLAKAPEKRERLKAVLYDAAECLRILSLYLYPFMPSTAESITSQLGLEIDFKNALLGNQVVWGALPPGTKIRKGSALFPRIESKPQGAQNVSDSPTSSQPPAAVPTAAAAATPPSPAPAAAAPAAASPAQITIDEFMKVQLKTAKVITAERVPKSEKLLKLQVSLGSEQRQIVAGIGKKYEPEALIGKTIVIVANLKPAKLMGIESQGMVLAAGDSEVRGLVTLLEDVEPGTKVK